MSEQFFYVHHDNGAVTKHSFNGQSAKIHGAMADMTAGQIATLLDKWNKTWADVQRYSMSAEGKDVTQCNTSGLLGLARVGG